MTLAGSVWPKPELERALEALASRMGAAAAVPVQSSPVPQGHAEERETGRLARRLDSAAARFGIEVEHVSATADEWRRLVAGGAPAILQVGETPVFLALVAARRGSITVLAPDLTLRRIPIRDIEDRLLPSAGAGRQRMAERLRGMGIAQHRVERMTRTIAELDATESLLEAWLLRLPPSAGFWRQLVDAKLTAALTLLIAAHGVQYVLWIGAWWLVGRGALDGYLDWAALTGWALLLLTLLPLQTLVTWLQGRIVAGGGALLKRRLLVGAQSFDPDEVRQNGVGINLGRVIESESVEMLALNGGLAGLMASVELAIAAVVFTLGATQVLHLAVFVAWLAVICFVALLYYRSRLRWTLHRLRLTHTLIEKLAGHRTILAQGLAENRHLDEDAALADYYGMSARMDRLAGFLRASPRAWVVLGIVALGPVLVFGEASTASIAVTLGGILLIHQGLSILADGLLAVAAAAAGWRQAQPMFHAAGAAHAGSTDVEDVQATRGGNPLLELQGVTFGYPARPQPILNDVSLAIRRGDRVRLTGHSGTGKSTLASILTGLRRPTSGLLLAHGLDYSSVGTRAWRRIVVAVPQFHENHLIADTLAFNLLMGRGWPPSQDDLRDAEQVCAELGLSALVDTMPAGIMQMVGDGGWRLSHGERSRIFVARALLQDPEILLLDESFSSLDPESFEICLDCVLKRIRTLLIVAHR